MPLWGAIIAQRQVLRQAFLAMAARFQMLVDLGESWAVGARKPTLEQCRHQQSFFSPLVKQLQAERANTEQQKVAGSTPPSIKDCLFPNASIQAYSSSFRNHRNLQRGRGNCSIDQHHPAFFSKGGSFSLTTEYCASLPVLRQKHVQLNCIANAQGPGDAPQSNQRGYSTWHQPETGE